MESDTGVSCEFYKIKSTFITKQLQTTASGHKLTQKSSNTNSNIIQY